MISVGGGTAPEKGFGWKAGYPHRDRAGTGTVSQVRGLASFTVAAATDWRHRCDRGSALISVRFALLRTIVHQGFFESGLSKHITVWVPLTDASLDHGWCACAN